MRRTWLVGQTGAAPSTLLDEMLRALELTVKDAAEKLGVSRQTLHAVLAEKTAVTAEMAVRLGKAHTTVRSDDQSWPTGHLHRAFAPINQLI